MYKGQRISVVVPAHNEGRQIERVLAGMPDCVDRIVVVDDASRDDTAVKVRAWEARDPRVRLIRQSVNTGCGGALASGYQWVRDEGTDVAVRMDGDGQMNPADLPALLDPVVTGGYDYAKGNRLFTGEAYRRMPKLRYFGNAFLSLLTKIASGYWHVADFQSGYTAIGRRALNTIDWRRMYTRYGQPNDLLIRLNVFNFRVCDVPVEPRYGVGEVSGMKIHRVLLPILGLLVRMFVWRMKEKYIIRDFHPLIFFYTFGGFFSLTAVLLFARVFYRWLAFGHIPPINALAAFFAFMSASLFVLFGMWFDMEANKDLK